MSGQDKKFSFREFVFEQKCVPWKVRLFFQRIIPWQIRRFLFYGCVNLNSPQAMDERYSKQGDDFVSMENLYEYILDFVPEKGRLLDAGCGIGVLLRMIREHKKGLELYGVDFSSVAVERVRGYGISAECVVLPELPYDDGYFDCIVCTEVLEHLDEPAKTVVSFHRVLKEGGLVIASVPDGMGPDDCDEHVQDFSEDEFRKLFSENGFSVISLEVVAKEPARKPGDAFVIVCKKV